LNSPAQQVKKKMMTQEEKDARYERQQKKQKEFIDEKRRRKEWESLIEETKTSLLRCYKCPIWSICPHQKRELSMKLSYNEEVQPRVKFPSQGDVDWFRDGLKVMRSLYGVCPLLKLQVAE